MHEEGTRAMEETRCYLAVDGGNSKTEYRLLDASGKAIASLRGGGTNHETLAGGYEEAADLLAESAQEMLAEHGFTLDRVEDAVLGLAGADYDEQAAYLTQLLQARGLTRCLVVNDGFLGVMAGAEDGVGICYSAGAGVTCAGIGPDGRRVKFGGLGILSGDAGGGYDIVAYVYRAIYRHLFFGDSATALKDAYFTLFDLHSPEEFLASAALLQNEETARQLIGLFFTAVDTGDDIAMRYAAKSASHAADCILAAADVLGLAKPVPVTLSGTILTSVAPAAYRRMIEYELIRRRGKLFQVRVSKLDPVEGAARWVRRRNGLD